MSRQSIWIKNYLSELLSSINNLEFFQTLSYVSDSTGQLDFLGFHICNSFYYKLEKDEQVKLMAVDVLTKRCWQQSAERRFLNNCWCPILLTEEQFFILLQSSTSQKGLIFQKLMFLIHIFLRRFCWTNCLEQHYTSHQQEQTGQFDQCFFYMYLKLPVG